MVTVTLAIDTRTVRLGVILQVHKLTPPVREHNAAHKPCKNQGTAKVLGSVPTFEHFLPASMH